MNVKISNVQNLWAWNFSLNWDPTYVELVGKPMEGNFLSDVDQTLFIAPLLGNSTPGIGDILMSQNYVGATASGTLVTYKFKAIKTCVETDISLHDLALFAPSNASAGSGTNPRITPVSDSAIAKISLLLPGAPVADAGPNQIVPEGTPVVLNASRSVSSAGNATYTWTVNDVTQKQLQGITANYTFDIPGVYNVTLTLQDQYGTSLANVQIAVLDKTPPVAIIAYQNETVSQPIQIQAGQPITLDGSQSYDPENGTISLLTWDMGDHTELFRGITATHTYSDPGTYHVALTVFDASQNNSTTTVTVQVALPQGQTSRPTIAPSQSDFSGTNPIQVQASFDLPPSVLAILAVISAFVLVGSGFWLRKKT